MTNESAGSVEPVELGEAIEFAEEMFQDLVDARMEFNGAESRYRSTIYLTARALKANAIGRKVLVKGFPTSATVIHESGRHVSCPVGGLEERPEGVKYEEWKIRDVNAETGEIELQHPESDTFYHTLHLGRVSELSILSEED